MGGAHQPLVHGATPRAVPVCPSCRSYESPRLRSHPRDRMYEDQTFLEA